MTPEFVTGFFFEAIKTAISLAAPMLLAGLAVGLLITIFQAATSISEVTLTLTGSNAFQRNPASRVNKRSCCTPIRNTWPK